MWICNNCGNNTDDDSNIFCGKCGSKRLNGSETTFDVILAGFDPAKKIVLIKNIRDLTACGLKDAKDFVENTPQIIGTTLTSQNADMLITRLKSDGAICEKCIHNTRQIYRPMPVQPLQNHILQSGLPANNATVKSTGCTTTILSVIAVIGLTILLFNHINF